MDHDTRPDCSSFPVIIKQAAHKTWRDVPLTAGMVCDAIGRWMIDRTSLSDAIRLSAEEKLK